MRTVVESTVEEIVSMSEFEDIEFGSLHNHTDYSNIKGMRDSINRVDVLIDEAYNKGYKSVAITDHSSVSGHIKAMAHYDKNYKDKDFKVILGEEIYLVDDIEYLKENGGRYYHMVLLAKNKKGHKGVRRISSASWNNFFMTGKLERTPIEKRQIEEIMKDHKGQIISTTACFLEGTEVVTDKGLKSIQDFKGGEKVITHNNRFKTVNHPTSRKYNGDIYSIKSVGGTQEISSTDNHKYFVITKEDFKNYSKFSVNTKYREEIYKSKKRNRMQLTRKNATSFTPKWVEAKDLEVGDFLLTPVDEREIEDTILDFSHIKNKPKHKNDVNSKDLKNYKIPIDKSFMEIMGLYVAEGHRGTHNHSVTFTFHEDEKDLHEKVVRYHKEVFGIDAYVYNRKNSKATNVQLISKHLWEIYGELFKDSTHSHNKKVPNCIKYANAGLQMYFVKGLFLGDGYEQLKLNDNGVDRNRVVYATTSKQLIYDTIHILHRNNINPNFTINKEHIGKDRVKHRESYYLEMNSGVANSLRDFIWKGKDFTLEYDVLRTKDFYFLFNGKKYMKNKISKIEVKKNIKTQVYCLNVQEDHSFTAHNIIVHNCLGSEFSQLVLKFIEEPTQDNKVKIHRFIKWCQRTFGEEDFYIELQPNDDIEQVLYNKSALRIAKAYGIKWIISTDSHYLNKEDGKIHTAFINANSDSGANERSEFYKTTYVMSTKEMWDYCKLSMTFEDFKQAMKNTMEITNKCEMYDLTAPVKIPQRDLPEFEVKHLFKDHYKDYKYINLFANSKEKQDLFFLYLVERGFIERKQEINEVNLKRIDDEMQVLWEVSIKLDERMSAYYNMMELLMEISWGEGDSIVGVSRGSGTGFYTGYLLGLSQINPITHNLPYWRHLSVDRPELPDWDYDTQNTRRKKILEAFKSHFSNEYDNVLNIGTFKTEGTKSTVLTCCRGMGINGDEASAMASLVKAERGKQWTIREMLYGDEKKGRKAVTEFKNAVAQYEGLEEALLKIEGLIVGKSVHASGIFIYKNGYIEENNSMMKTASGVEVTSFDMNDSTDVGNLKYDALTVEALDKIRVCMDLLVRDGYMEWQGTLKKTYDKYLHPDVLDYETQEMWNMLGEGVILDVFQFQTDIGIQTIKKTKPTNLEQLAHANSLMRLSCDGDETPTETFVRYKNDINEWYKDMEKVGLTKEEMKILEPHILSLSGIASTQEDVMEMSMNEEISGFTETEANKLRKGIGKKIEAQILASKELFFKKGLERGNSELFLNYVWNEQFGKQLGYAFSRNHTMPYSVIAIQEMNLAYHYPMIYWLTSVLICNSGSADEEQDGTTNYGKVATAIGNVQRQGVNVALPHINNAGYTFEPDVEGNRVYYGLFAISGINQEIAHYIIKNRPYASLDDFIDKTQDVLKNGHYLTLIKAGAFDELEGKSRIEIMRHYLERSVDKVTKIDGRHVVKMLNNKLTPYYNTLQARYLKYRNYIFSSKFEVDTEYTTKNKKFYQLDHISEEFFEQYFADLCQEGRQYFYNDKGIVVNKNTFDTVIKKVANEITEWTKTEEALEMYNKMLVDEELKSKYTSIAQWEIESLNYYYSGHIMSNCELDNHGVEDFFDLSETPRVKEKRKSKKGFEYNVYNSYRIAGTVVHKDKNKHVVYLLTPTGVVPVKYRDGVFSHYDKQISEVQPDGKKKVLSKSWFGRHTHLMIEGYRRDDQFIPYVDKATGAKHTTMRVIEINKDREYPLTMEYERPRVNKK